MAKVFQSVWFQDIQDEQERAKLQSYLQNDELILDKLTKIVYNMIRRSEDISISAYDNPSWLAKQAHLNGRNEALRELLLIATPSER